MDSAASGTTSAFGLQVEHGRRFGTANNPCQYGMLNMPKAGDPDAELSDALLALVKCVIASCPDERQAYKSTVGTSDPGSTVEKVRSAYKKCAIARCEGLAIDALKACETAARHRLAGPLTPVMKKNNNYVRRRVGEIMERVKHGAIDVRDVEDAFTILRGEITFML
jgi:hypothetical protein